MSRNGDLLLKLAKDVLGEMGTEDLLEELLACAREMTGARYAALGVLDGNQDGAPGQRGLERFLVSGVDEQTRTAIGALPKGRGVLGQLIDDPRPLRVPDIGAHPYSYGFPDAHPPMHSFLGVPIVVTGKPFANIYLTEKSEQRQFTAADESAIVELAELAGLAIESTRRRGDMRTRSDELERAVTALEVTTQITQAVGGQTDLEAILELVAKRGRAVVDARLVLVVEEDASELVVVAGAGEMPAGMLGRRLPLDGTVPQHALRTRRTLRLTDPENRARFEGGLGAQGITAEDGLVLPLLFHDQTYGVLVAIDRLHDGPQFSSDDVPLLEAFAASAATALATGTALSSDLQRLAAVVESSSDAIITVDRQGRITTWNPGAEALYGLTSEEMLGRRGIDAMPGLSQLELDKNVLARVLAGELIAPHEITREHADGTQLELSLSISAIRDVRGRVMGAASITRDVGEHNRLQRLLAQRESDAAPGRLPLSAATSAGRAP